MKPHFAKLLLCLLPLCPVWAGSKHHTQQITLLNHPALVQLRSEKIWDIHQDDSGRMYFAGRNGLYVFDGNKLTLHNSDNSDGGLPEDEIYRIVEASDGRLWLTLMLGGLSMYDPRSEQLTHFSQLNRSGPVRHVHGLAEDQHGRLWIATLDKGLFTFEPNTQNLTHLSRRENPPPWLQSDHVVDALIDRNQQLWLSFTESAVVRVDLSDPDSNYAVFNMRPDTEDEFSNLILRIQESPAGELYFIGSNGIHRWNPDSGKIELWQDNAAFGFDEPNRLNSLQWHDDGLWIATDNGLFQWRQDRLNAIALISSDGVLSNQAGINAVIFDHHGFPWLASQNRGPLILAKNLNINSYHVAAAGTKAEQLFDFSFDLQRKGLWMALGSAGLVRVDLLSGEMQPVSVPALATGDFSTAVTTVYADDDRLWIGTPGGLYTLNPDTSELTDLTHLFGQDSPANVLRIYPAHERHQWLQMNNQGYELMNTETLETHPFVLDFDFSLITMTRTTAAGELLCVTPHAVYRSDLKTQHMQAIFRSAGGIADIAPDKDGHWLLMNNRVHRLRDDGRQLQLATGTSIAPPAGVLLTDMVSDARGDLWFSTSQNGLYRWLQSSGEWQQFAHTEGLPSQKITDIVRLEDGQIAGKNPQAVIHLQPEKTHKIMRQSRLDIHAFYMDDRPVALSDAPLEVPYDATMVAIEYSNDAVIDQPGYFQIRLAELDQDWSNAEQEYRQVFRFLEAGNYTFQVRKKYLDDSMHSNVATIQFRVRPKPWLTWWAYALYLAAALSLGALVYRFQLRRRLLHAQYQQSLEKRRFAESQLSLTSSLVKTLDVQEVLQRTVNQMREQFGCDRAFIGLWHRRDESLTWHASHGFDPPPSVASFKSTAEALHQSGHDVEHHQSDAHSISVLLQTTEDYTGLLSLHKSDQTINAIDQALIIAQAAQSSVALENARLFNEVRHLARMANEASQAKSDFLARVSHEVRTPMNGVLGMTELMMDTPLNDEQQVYARSIMDSGEHLLEIINDILDLSKIEAGKLELECKPFRLLELIEEVFNAFVSQSKKTHVLLLLDFRCDSQEMRIGDALRIKQIIYNLLSNAFKFTAKGHITLRVECDADDSELLRVHVIDTGIGIDNALAEELFKPFVQADSSTTRKFGGTGLGLAIVKQLSEKMHGGVHAQGEHGRGSHFHVHLRLPVTRAAASEAPAKTLNLSTNIQHPALQAALASLQNLPGIQISHDNGAATDGLLIDAVDSLSAGQITAIKRALHADRPVHVLVFSKQALAEQRKWLKQADIALLQLPICHSDLSKCLRSEQPAQRRPAAEIKQQHGGPIHVLVVEDHATNQQLVIEILENMGHEVEVVELAEEALLRVQLIDYDLLLVDFHLPHMDGISMLEVLQHSEQYARNRNTPAILVTADLTAKVFRRSEQVKIEHILTKPFKRKTLEQAVQSIVDAHATDATPGEQV